jgi:hypothetical protein
MGSITIGNLSDIWSIFSSLPGAANGQGLNFRDFSIDSFLTQSSRA